jgi:arginyl-tRNA synthetase
MLREKDLTYTKDGAEYLKTTQFGDDQDRVLAKQDGEYAYIAPDIAYHQQKYERKFDHIFTFLGADHQGHVPKLKAAMEALGNDTSKLHFVIAQWMSLVKDGKPFKPSKRKGHVYGPKELIDEIGYDAARFFMVQHNLSSHMELNLDVAKERSERNPVYYVQYAYVRLQSILRKAKERGLIDSVDDSAEPLVKEPHYTEQAEYDLIRVLYRLPEAVEEVCRTFEPHRLTYYAHDLAKATHIFYKQAPILSVENSPVAEHRLQLVFAARKVLGETLDLLGISKPDVM